MLQHLYGKYSAQGNKLTWRSATLQARLSASESETAACRVRMEGLSRQLALAESELQRSQGALVAHSQQLAAAQQEAAGLQAELRMYQQRAEQVRGARCGMPR